MSHLFNNGFNFTREHQSVHAEVRLERRGDVRYPRIIEKIGLENLGVLGVEIIPLGKTKLISMAEFHTIRRTRIKRDKLYFDNNPPTAVLDMEDPDREMTRYIVPIPREVVTKGSKFLFGKGRFNGSESFVFDSAKSNAKFQKGWDQAYADNCLDALLPRIARTALATGDAYLKFISKTTVQTSIVVPEENDLENLNVDEDRTTEINFEWMDSEHMHAITERDKPKNVVSWIHQFQRSDGTFFREEIFKDVTYVYEGIKKIDPNNKETVNQKASLNITGSGLRVAEMDVQGELVEFLLIDIIEYPDFEEFPLIQFLNDPDSDLYGTSVYHGILGKFDMLNAIFTRSLHALENQATPLLWVSGAPDNTGHDVHTSDAVWYFPNENTKLQVLQWEGTPQPVFDFIDRIEKQIFRLVGVPRSSDMQAFTNVSAEALNIINTDIIDTTNERRVYFEKSFKQMVRLVRKALGQKKAVEDSMTIKWGPIFPEAPDKFNEHLLALLREKVIRSSYVIKSDPLIPSFEKEELMQIAEEMQVKEESLKEEAIAAQAKKVTSGASGNLPTRGKGQKTKPGEAKPKPQKRKTQS